MKPPTIAGRGGTSEGRRSGLRPVGGERNDDDDELPPRERHAVELVVRHLHRVGAIDLRGHRRTSTARLLRRRVERLGLRGYGDYLAHLEAHAVEARLVGHELRVNFTTFFRDPPIWSRLGRVVDGQVEGERLRRPFRVWSAGCATGEEAYSLAILCSEVFGRAACSERVKIYATDIDARNVEAARQGTFRSSALERVPPELRAAYFRATERAGRSEFDRELRRVLVFGQHDLENDPPLTQIDLVLCRNTLMFFRREAQRRLLRRLWFSLRPTGALVVGASELVAPGSLFITDEHTHQILHPVATRSGRRTFADRST